MLQLVYISSRGIKQDIRHKSELFTCGGTGAAEAPEPRVIGSCRDRDVTCAFQQGNIFRVKSKRFIDRYHGFFYIKKY